MRQIEDAFATVLDLLRPQKGIHASGFEVAGDWAFAFKAHDGIKCYAVAKGSCWLEVEGGPAPIHLHAGQCFLMTRGYPFIMASDLAVAPLDAVELFNDAHHKRLISFGKSSDFSLVGGHFLIEAAHSRFLLECLPPVICVRDRSDCALLTWCLEQMIFELQAHRLGSDLVAQHLAQMMLVQTLRIFLSEHVINKPGWLCALADRQIGSALHVIHQEPAHRWSLKELAAATGMSRTSFASRFKEMVGLSPMDYLTRWRMLVAGERMRTSDISISAVAHLVGYESESSFSTAFKREMGCSPKDYSKSAGLGSAKVVRQSRG